jgi:2'-5' RNA ligase
VRCFIAIELPDEVRGRLVRVQERLAGLGRAVRWTKAAQAHLTVKFLGEVPDDRIALVCEAARRIAGRHPPFELTVQGLGCFPPRGPVRVLWAGVEPLPPALIDCRRECEQTFVEMGYEREHRPFAPHLTLGRVTDLRASTPIREALRAAEPFSAGTFTVHELIVFESVLAPSGPRHTPLARAALRT